MLRIIFLFVALVGIGEGLFNVMFVVFIRQVLHGGALEFGWLTSAQAVGGLLGSILVGWFGARFRPERLMVFLAFNGMLILLLVNQPWLPLALVLILIAGIPIVAQSVGRQTLLQRNVADAYLGRVFSALMTTMAILVLVGQAIASALGDRVGPQLLLYGKGTLDIIAGLAALFGLR